MRTLCEVCQPGNLRARLQGKLPGQRSQDGSPCRLIWEGAVQQPVQAPWAQQGGVQQIWSRGCCQHDHACSQAA